jgi:hypothetical protein
LMTHKCRGSTVVPVNMKGSSNPRGVEWIGSQVWQNNSKISKVFFLVFLGISCKK